MKQKSQANEFVFRVPETEEHISFNIFKCDIPDDVELQFDDPRLNKDNSLYLTIQQEYFDQIIAGTKTIEYRLLKGTTFKRMIVSDEYGPVQYRDDIPWPEKCTVEEALHFFNEGDFPFTPQNYNFLRFKAGATAKDMDSAVVEVLYITVDSQDRFDLTPDGKCKANPMGGKYCDWIIEFHLGKIRGVHRKAR